MVAARASSVESDTRQASGPSGSTRTWSVQIVARTCSADASTRTTQRNGRTSATRSETNAAGSPPGISRGAKRGPVGQPVRGQARREAVDAQGAPVLAVAVPGHEVPAPPPGDEVDRLDAPAGRGPVAGGVVDLEHAPVAARPAHDGEHRRVDRRRDARRHDRHRHRRDPVPQARGQDPFELDQRGERRLPRARHPGPGRGPQRHRDRDGLVVVEQQRRQRGPGAEAVAAAGPEADLDRVVEPAELVDVPAHGAGGDPRAARRAPGPSTPGVPAAARAGAAGGRRSRARAQCAPRGGRERSAIPGTPRAHRRASRAARARRTTW